MYDVASIAPYIELDQWKTKPPKLAMSIGGENRVGHLSLGNLRKMVERCGLEEAGITAEGCARLIALYAETIPEMLSNVFDDLELTASAQAARELRARMEQPIAQLCATTKARLAS